MCDLDDLLSDILGRQNIVDPSARYCASEHVGMVGRIELLRDGDAAGRFDLAERSCSTAMVAGDGDGEPLSTRRLSNGDIE